MQVEITKEMKLDFIKQMIARLSMQDRIGLTAKGLKKLDKRIAELCNAYNKLKGEDMPRVGHLKITPITIEEFRKKFYHDTSIGFIADAYHQYLVINKGRHHYCNHKTLEAWYEREIDVFTFDLRTEIAEDMLHTWLDKEYESKDVSSWQDKDAMTYAIQDLALEANATMHNDDPSLIQLHFELDLIENLLEPYYGE